MSGWIAIALALVVAVLIMAQLAVEGLIPTVPAATNLGEVGAAYGAAGAIISGSAFVAVVVSLVGQRRQIRRQEEALTEQQARLEAQTEALTVTSEAQRIAAESLQGQLAHMSRRARLDDYDRRLERFVEVQASLDGQDLDVPIASGISHGEARERLGRRYLAALLNVLRSLERLRSDPALAEQAEEMRRELRTSLDREQALLYLAVVPTWIPDDYMPTELGRLMSELRLFPYVDFESEGARVRIFRERFFRPLRSR